MKQTERWKASGAEDVRADLLRVDEAGTGHVLTELFSVVWAKKRTPRSWRKGLLIKILKKEDMLDVTTGG